jgi:hypothetical protein
MTHQLTWTVALYRLALHVYPAAFRRAFSAELVRDMELASEERWRTGGWPGLVGLWGRTLADLAVSAPAQWARAGWPVATWLIGAASVATVAVAWRVHRVAWRMVDAGGDHEIAVLLVAVSAVLLVVVCTLTFTTWIVRPRRRRHR